MKLAALVICLSCLFGLAEADVLAATQTRKAQPKKTTAKPKAKPAQAASPAPAAAAGAAGTAGAAASMLDQPAQAPEPVWPEGPAGDAAKSWSKGDFENARKIWEKLAADGDAQAMNNLGVIYDQGKGVEADAGRAAHWFAQSANAGNPSGMANYGRMLEQGRGLPSNPAEAARWFDLAARKGQAEAQYNLGLLYENGRGVTRDETAAAAWYSRAASQNQKDALAKLGHLYRMGRGVEKNQSRAALLLYAAAMEGSEAAISELEAMARENPNHAEAVLFGQKLAETNRKNMRAALKKAGATPKREADSHICDVYDSTKIVPGTNEMAVCYGQDGKLGFLKLDYGAPDSARADMIYKMVESRFGQPTAGEGEDARLWNLGPIIVATKYAPTHGQMSLMYMAPKVYHLATGKDKQGRSD